MPGDEAIVYDNTDPHHQRGREPPRFEDNCISIHTGKAHLSPTPFGQSPIWGWGDAWRDRREFVGQLNYGVLYQLWNPERHNLFGTNFRAATESLLLLQRRYESPISMLPDACVYYVLNMCRWDWFEDDGRGMKQRWRAHKLRLRAQEEERRQQEAEVTAMQEEDEEDAEMEQMDDASNNGNEEEAVDEEEDSDDNEEGAWERAHGYRADTAAFRFLDVSSDEEESDNEEEHAGANRWIRRQVARIRVLRLPRHHRVIDSSDDDDDDSDFEP